MLFDTAGHRMTPSYAVKPGRRYRYYVSRPRRLFTAHAESGPSSQSAAGSFG
jgi:hypothetical protein